jgi:putative ABC transport system permease protein
MSRIALEEQLESYFINYVEARPDKYEIHPRVYDWQEDTRHQRASLARLYGLFGGVFAALFIIALCNSVTFILLRTSGRGQEILIRISMGATRRQLFQQFLAEGMFLVFLSFLFGVLTMTGLIEGLKTFLPNLLPVSAHSVYNLATVLLMLGMSGILLLLFAILPVIWTRRLELGEITRAGRGVSRKLRALPLLGGAQVAITAILVVFAFLFIYSANRVKNLDPGYRTNKTLVFFYDFRLRDLDVNGGNNLRREIETVVEAMPQIERASTGALNFLRFQQTISFLNEGETRQDQKGGNKTACVFMVGPGFLEVMGIPLLRGRGFEESDRPESKRVVLVSETLANQYFPEDDVLGERIHLMRENRPLNEIVGVFRDIHVSPEKSTYPVIFVSMYQHDYTHGTVTAQVRGDVETARHDLLKKLDTAFPSLGIDRVRSGRELIGRSTRGLQSGALLVSAAGVNALFLSLAGLLVVFSFGALLRRKDFAIRLAVGATPFQVFRNAFCRFEMVSLVGLVLGILIALCLTPLVEDSLIRVDPRDPRVFMIALLLVFFSCSVIALGVAWRTLYINPAQELQG